MKVLIVVDNTFVNDIRVTKEARILMSEHEVHVLCLQFDHRESNHFDSRVTLHPVIIRRKLKDFLYLIMNTWSIYEWFWTRLISKSIRELKPDVIHVHDLYMSKATRKAIDSAKSKAKMVLDLHENYPEAIKSYNWTKGWWRSALSKPNCWSGKEKSYLEMADQLIVLSNDFKKTLVDRYAELKEKNNITVFPNVIDITQFAAFEIDKTLEKRSGVTLLYFGGIAERRGIFETMDAVAEIAKEGYELTLLMIGPVDNVDRVRFEHRLQSTDLNGKVEHIEWIDVNQLPSYMHISDICLAPFQKNPQHESGVANKLFQYMFGAKPIVASDCKPQKDLIENAGCGIIFSNQSEYVSALRKLIVNSALRVEMGENGRKELMEKYANPDYEKILIDLYRKFVN